MHKPCESKSSDGRFNRLQPESTEIVSKGQSVIVTEKV